MTMMIMTTLVLTYASMNLVEYYNRKEAREILEIED